MKLRTPYSLNEIGQRANQEDSIFPAKGVATAESRLFLVCDGMGGHENGEVASGLVCSTFGQMLNNVDHDNFTTDMFLDTLSAAYDALDKEDPNPESTRKMGTTLTFLHIGRDEVTVAHMGDSRVYQVRPNSVEPIVYKSNDHSLVNELVRAEIITPEEALTHPRRNVITRAMQPNLETRHKADVRTFQDVQDGDYFFLCSDGVLESVTDDILVEVLRRDVSDAEKIEAIRALCQANSRDNFSAYLVPIAEGTGYVAPIVAGATEELLVAEVVTEEPGGTQPVFHSSPADEIEDVKVPKRKSMIMISAVLVAAVVGFIAYMLIPSSRPEANVPSIQNSIAEETDNSVPDVVIANVIQGNADLSAGEIEGFEVSDVTENDPDAKLEEIVPESILRLTSDNSVTLSHSGSNGTISYSLENPVSGVNLSVSDDASWLTTSRSGDTISYSASANESQSSRTATITVRYGGQSFEVAITQSGKPAPAPDPVLRLTSNSRVTVEHGGGNGTIRYTLENPVSGVNLSVSDNANWLTTSRLGNVIGYSASANESQSSRTAAITVSYGDQNFEVAITQSGKPVPASEPETEPEPEPEPKTDGSSANQAVLSSTTGNSENEGNIVDEILDLVL